MIKKALFTTLITMCFTCSAYADEDLRVKLGGRIDTMVGNITQKGDFNKVQNANAKAIGKRNKSSIVTDSKIHINADHQVTEDFSYGGLLWLHADTSTATNDEPGIADKVMIYMQHNKVGRLEGGNYPGAGGVFEMDTTNIAKAAYGVEGYWSKWVNDGAYQSVSVLPFPAQPSTIVNNLGGYKYLITPNLPSNYSGYYYSDASKLTFYTEPLKGLFLGVSWIPDMDSTGSIATIGGPDGPNDPTRKANGYRPTFKNIISGGIQYAGEYGDFKYKASFAGEIGKAKKYRNTNLVRDLKAYEVGARLGYKQFSIGGSYGSWLKTATYKEKFANTKQGSDYWTLLFAHDIENFGYSISYMQSRKAGGLEAIGAQVQVLAAKPFAPNYIPQKDINYSDTKYNRFSNISFGMEYKLAPGLLPYAEVSRFRYKDANGAMFNNRGYVTLAGLRVNF